MEDVRQLVQEEGREARNLVAFHVAVDTPAPTLAPAPFPALARVSRKPPRAAPSPSVGGAARAAGRLRSASAGRDKRSELRARYWALLFDNMQRAVGEIYNTVEAHENLNECQEVILVLENYTRDFKALAEWFRLKWEYDNTPPPQRPQSLAWEIRKTDFVRPESRRTSSLRSSPSVSGKNSPCLSGHNTPSGKNSPVTGKASPASGKISPRVTSHASTSPKGNIEFFSNKIASKITTRPEPKSAKEAPRLSDIKERDVKDAVEDTIKPNTNIATNTDVKRRDSATPKVASDESKPLVEIGKAKECPNDVAKPVIIKSVHKSAKVNKNATEELSSQAKTTVTQLDAMENAFLSKQLVKNQAKNENMINEDKQIELTSKLDSKQIELTSKLDSNDKQIENSGKKVEKDSSESPIKYDDNFADVSNNSSSASNDTIKERVEEQKSTSKDSDKPEHVQDDKTNVHVKTDDSIKTSASEVNTNVQKVPQGKISPEPKVEEKDKTEAKNDAKLETKQISRPAYSQAAAKPKQITTKPDVKSVKSAPPIIRSKILSEMPKSASNINSRQFPKRNQISRCSYPFNLTTGRTSLFDSSSSKVAAKKPIGKSPQTPQVGSGDNKILPTKVDPKKRPQRPTSLKINEKGDKKEKANAALEKIKDCEEYSSTDTIVTQIDMSRIESSESLKTLVPEEKFDDVANSIEVLNVDGNKNDNEGWLTVKSRRLSRESKKQSKSHWVNRFHQPSATTSLPTLNMLESPKLEVSPVTKSPRSSKSDRAQSEQPERFSKPAKLVKVTVKPKSEKTKNPAMIRQKSDVTGLKTRSSRNKLAKKEKKESKNDGELTKNRLHSSLESLTTGLARSQESTEDAFDFDKWKAEFKFNFKYLDEDDHIPNHNEILKTADPSEMSEIAEMTSQIEENERKISLALDFQSEVDEKKLCDEEDLLNRQIMELQQVSDIDLDTETDDTETDAEILIGDTSPAGGRCSSPETLGALAASLEEQYETALAGMSWAERVDTLVVLESLVARDPGRAQQLHEKLSQGIKRRGSLQDALRRLQAKQARAERQRQQYQTERARRIHQLLARVEEVKVAKNQLIEEKRLRMERRLQKAAENRDQHLKDIVRKAHDEEEKLREIAFIKQLEAENKRHDFLDQCRSYTTRLRQLRRDRLNKLEQKAAREAAVGARRLALEAARRQHVETLLTRRKERDARVEERKGLRKQERDDAAREKAEGVKSRLSALAAAAELEADALRSRIRDKQDASQQRLDAHLQAIREKATGPRQMTTSESQDQKDDEQTEAQRLEQERKEREKQKAIKKKARKIKQKLLAASHEAAEEIGLPDLNLLPNNKMHKSLYQLTSILAPLLEDTQTNEKSNHIDENKQKNKSANNKLVNGNDGQTKKKKKEPDRDPSLESNKVEKINVIVINNNNTDLIIDTKSEKLNDSHFEDLKGENTKDLNNEKPESNKKRNKRNKNHDKDKLNISKSSSVCSSLSDMSKTSGKSEKANMSIDSMVIERLLNELSRVMDKLDMVSSAKRHGKSREHTAIITQKLVWLKTLSYLIAVPAEREHLAAQFTPKCITTGVTLISRLVSRCVPSAAFLLAAPLAVHLVKLLQDQLEKDLTSDLREAELAKQISDCLAIAFDSVLCASRIHERKGLGDQSNAEAPPKKNLEAHLATLRQRTHMLISYLCLSGCVTRAEHAGNVRENILALLGICCSLTMPCDVDVGTERTSALQSLRCALGTSLCGARAEFCILFAQDSDYQTDCDGFVRAARTANFLKTVAEMDHHIVQESFGEGGWPLEFRAAVARLLQQHAPNDKEAPRTTALCQNNRRLDQKVSEKMVMDLLTLVGFVVVGNPQLQETICEGWSVIKMMCNLPANWLVAAPQSHALLPALAALAERPATAAVIAGELSMQMLEEYLQTEEANQIKLVNVIKQVRNKKNSGKK